MHVEHADMDEIDGMLLGKETGDAQCRADPIRAAGIFHSNELAEPEMVGWRLYHHGLDIRALTADRAFPALKHEVLAAEIKRGDAGAAEQHRNADGDEQKLPGEPELGKADFQNAIPHRTGTDTGR